MNPSFDRQFNAIFTLLSDQDEKTVDLVRQTLIDIGPEVVPSLERAKTAAAPHIRGQLQTVVEQIRQNDLENRFRDYAGFGEADPDLEEGSLLIARFGCPDLDPAATRLALDRIADEISNRSIRKNRPEEVIHGINRHLFEELGFHGNTEDYYNPDNSYLNRVLEQRAGIPISLSVVYLLVAKRLGLPISGVGLPGHFMLKYEREDGCLFLDAFHQGQILTREECIRFLLNSGYEIQSNQFSSATVRDILTRMLRNLVYAYSQLKDKEKAHRLTRLLHILQLPAQG
ncbi:MAG TPA: transglutaminase-like domain-containing protein [Nitrospiria bacterium]|nr:transglutaminase-like domain-containing protein [Nitrospiria bacterium]